MHFLQPDRYDLLERDFDLTDEDKEAKIRELHTQLKDIMLRRLKKDVVKSLPTKSERILRVEMSQMQVWWYKNILSRVSICLAALFFKDLTYFTHDNLELHRARFRRFASVFVEYRHGIEESVKPPLLVRRRRGTDRGSRCNSQGLSRTQRQDDSAGQIANAIEGGWTPRPNLHPNGSHAVRVQ